MPMSFHPYSNFFYDPSRQGYDSSVWKTIFGTPGVTPGVSGNVLMFSQSAAIHLGDCVKGDYSFNLIIPNSPAGGESRRIGLYSPNLSAYIWFAIEDETLKAQISDGTSTNEASITWESAWSNTSTEFKIHWDAGMARFYIAGALKATLSNSSALPKTPLAIYISNANEDSVTVNAINATGVHTFYLNQDHDDSVFLGGNPYVVQTISITEDVTLDPTSGPALFSESVSIVEDITREMVALLPSENEALSIAEDVALTHVMDPGDTSEALSLAEDIVTEWTIGSGNGEDVTIGESLAVVLT